MMSKQVSDRFDEKFPKLGHLHDQNCEFECHLRPDIKQFLAEELQTRTREVIEEIPALIEKAEWGIDDDAETEKIVKKLKDKYGIK